MVNKELFYEILSGAYYRIFIPIAVLVVLSFNDSRSRVVWGGFTLEWYKTLFHNSDVVAARLQNFDHRIWLCADRYRDRSVLAACGDRCHEKKELFLTLGVGNIPMLNADIVTGITFDALVSRFTNLGYVSISYISANIICDFKCFAEASADGHERL